MKSWCLEKDNFNLWRFIMKKVLNILTFIMLFTLITSFTAYSDEGIFTILSTGDEYTQTNALALSVRTLIKLNNKNEKYNLDHVHVMRCCGFCPG